MHRAVFIVYLVVTMATGVISNQAYTLCGDSTGYNCLFKTNTEELEDLQVQFDNPLPPYLTGTLIENGLGQFERGYQSVTHVFDGFAKLSSWKIFSNGTAFFSTRFVRSGFYRKTMSSDHLAPYMQFASLSPQFNFTEKMQCFTNGFDNMNVNIVDFVGINQRKSLAVYADNWASYEFFGKNLSTIRKIKPQLSTNSTARLPYIDSLSSAHPLPEPGTNNRLTFLIRQKTLTYMTNRLVLVRMSSIQERTQIAEWELTDLVPYMHSFSVTQTKVVMVAAPFVSDARCLFMTAAPLPCMMWDENIASTLYIFNLKTNQKMTLKMPAVFALHHINAYDLNDDEIIMDVASYDSPIMVNRMLLMGIITDPIDRVTTNESPRNKRLHVNLATNLATIKDYSTNELDGLDMPVINENYRSKKYCYFYGINFKANAVVKKDMCNGGIVAGGLQMYYHYPLEPAFVPNPSGTQEDDGVLLVPYLRGPDVVTYLAVLDPKTMTIISKADLPTYVPFTIHGKFYPEHFQ